MNNWLVKLEAEMKERGVNKTALGVDLGISAQAVHNWFYGTSKPSSESLIAIEKDWGVKCIEWDQEV